MAAFAASLSEIDVSASASMQTGGKERDMSLGSRLIGSVILATLVVTHVPAQTGAPAGPHAERGPYARLATLHPRDGETVDFEAGYLRHLAWHQQGKDAWTWYGWTATFSERQRSFVYATFGHSAASLDSPVPPEEDERDNVQNVAPHVDHWSNALYEYLPALSRGTGEPQPAARVELTTVDLLPGGARAFEAAVAASQPALRGETLWYRMVAGGAAPRYVRLRPRPSLAALVEAKGELELPEAAYPLIAKSTVEILTLRPTLSLGLASPAHN